MDRRETHIYVVIKRIYIPSGGGGFCLGEGSTAVFRLFLQFGSELFMMDCLFNLLYCRVQWGEYNYQIGLLDLKTSCFLLLLLLPIKNHTCLVTALKTNDGHSKKPYHNICYNLL